MAVASEQPVVPAAMGIGVSMRRIKKSWAVAFLLAGVCVAGWFALPRASAGSPPSRSPSGVVGGKVNVDPGATLRWWTPARMGSAKPVTVTIGKAPGAQRPVGQGTTPGTPGLARGGLPKGAPGT